MSPNPSQVLWTIQCSQPGDPAVDMRAPDALQALAMHARHRTPETLAAVPLKADAKAVTKWGLRPLSGAEYAYVMRQSDAPEDVLDYARCEAAFLLGVHQRTGPDGAASCTPVQSGKLLLATESWMEDCWQRLRAAGIAELGALVIQRSRLGDAGPFSLPAGTALAR
jgi:hypothetical protein